MATGVNAVDVLTWLSRVKKEDCSCRVSSDTVLLLPCAVESSSVPQATISAAASSKPLLPTSLPVLSEADPVSSTPLAKTRSSRGTTSGLSLGALPRPLMAKLVTDSLPTAFCGSPTPLGDTAARSRFGSDPPTVPTGLEPALQNSKEAEAGRTRP